MTDNEIRQLPKPPADAADQIDEALKALDNARHLRVIWQDLQRPADVARRQYEAAVGVVRALMPNVAEQVAA